MALAHSTPGSPRPAVAPQTWNWVAKTGQPGVTLRLVLGLGI
jgi:hypothetical protein